MKTLSSKTVSLSPTPNKNFSTNDIIRLAGTFHAMHAIAAQITPICPETKATGFLSNSVYDGINIIEADTFRMHNFQTYTGMKFVLVSDVAHSNTNQEEILKKIYEIYTDYVSKNPF